MVIHDLENFWPDTDHDDPAQKNRRKWARDNGRITTASLDKKAKSAVYHGTSGKYKTALDGCTCEDFQQRKLPCKHIYRLAYELGIIERPKKAAPPGIPKADIELTRKDLGISPGKIFHIGYKGGRGDVSERDIEIQKLAYAGDKLYVYAYCHMRKTTRSFLASRITYMTYEGRQINNFQDLLTVDNDVIENLVRQALE